MNRLKFFIMAFGMLLFISACQNNGPTTPAACTPQTYTLNSTSLNTTSTLSFNSSGQLTSYTAGTANNTVANNASSIVITDSAGVQTTVTFDSQKRITGMSHPQTVSTYSYNSQGYLASSVTTYTSGGTTLNQTFTWSNGNLVSITTPETSGSAGMSATFTADAHDFPVGLAFSATANGWNPYGGLFVSAAGLNFGKNPSKNIASVALVYTASGISVPLGTNTHVYTYNPSGQLLTAKTTDYSGKVKQESLTYTCP